MSHALLTVGRRRRYVSLLLAVGLVATLVPVLPVVADPPDVTYSYDFSGVDNDPWESGWSFVGDETPTIESNRSPRSCGAPLRTNAQGGGGSLSESQLGLLSSLC